jgi:predicted O-methyltransferase YrrM
VLAGGARVRVGETGTGCGVGLAWLVTGLPPGVPVVSVEQCPERVAATRTVFAGRSEVTVLCADWTEIYAHGPFDLLVLDGGGQGKNGAAVDPARLLVPGGRLVIDDFTPSPAWPPQHHGRTDDARLHWLDHPDLRAVDLPVAPDLSVIVATRRHPPA